MYVLNDICFVCLTHSEKDSLKTVLQTKTGNELFTHVKYALPEFTNFESEIPAHICSSCHKTLFSFYKFKEKCLKNYNQWKNYIKILRDTSYTQHQTHNELQVKVIDCGPLIKQQQDINIDVDNIKEEIETNHQIFNETPIYNNNKTEANVDDDIVIKEDIYSNQEEAYIIQLNNIKDENDCKWQSSEVQSAAEDNINTREEDATIKTKLRTCKLGLNSGIQKFRPNQDYQCPLCKKDCFNKETLDTHLINHVKNLRGFRCPICRKQFKRIFDTQTHLKIHLGIKQFQCHICQRQFVQKHTLTAHLKYHFGVRNYECIICSKKFVEKSSLKLHLKIHAGIKDFQCSICQRRFLRGGHLKSHLNKKRQCRPPK